MSAIAGRRWCDEVQTGALSCAGTFDKSANLAAVAILLVATAQHWVAATVRLDQRATTTDHSGASDHLKRTSFADETLIAGYAGAPFYKRSNLHLIRPDGTDLELKGLGWDGDALYFPIDGGIRSVNWSGSAGFMIDFLHNKAIARLGSGAHGRKLKDPVIETVEAAGTLKGQPAPSQIKLTDQFQRLEFTHGHNVLLFTPLFRLPETWPGVRLYFGFGGGAAIPHVEVWFPGDAAQQRTNEYQFAGPAAQAVAVLEYRVGKISYFVEYKYTYAWIKGALTGEQSWLNFNMPGDLWRQLTRWWRREEPKLGRINTTLGAHQIIFGAGYWKTKAQPTQ